MVLLDTVYRTKNEQKRFKKGYMTVTKNRLNIGTKSSEEHQQVKNYNIWQPGISQTSSSNLSNYVEVKFVWQIS